VEIGLSRTIQQPIDKDSSEYSNLIDEDTDFDISYNHDEELIEKLHEIDNILKERELLGEPVGELLLSKASVYYKQRDLDRSLKTLELALDNFKSERNELKEAICHNEIGLVQEETGFFEQAIYHFERALSILDEIQDNHKIIQVLNNLGNVYLQINDIEHSYESYQKALNLAENENLEFEAIKSASNLVETLFHLKEYDRIKKILLNNSNYFEQNNDIYGMIQTFIKYGKLYYFLGEDTFELSYERLNQALKLVDKVKDQVTIFIKSHLEWEIYLYLGLIKITWDNDIEAENFLLKSLEAIRIFEIRESIKEGLVLENIAKLYSIKGEDKKAVEYYNVAIEIYDKYGDKLKIAELKFRIGKIFYDFLQDRIKSIQYLEEALEIYEDLNYIKKGAEVLTILGIIHEKNEKIELAISYYTRAKQYYIELHDTYNSSIIEEKLEKIAPNNESL
jgi:tetratricopeptide (TPR) repeat protein